MSPALADAKLDHFARHLKLDRGLSPKTIEAYSTDVRPFLRVWGARLAKVRKSDLEDHLSALSKTGVGHRSLARKLSALRLFFRLAVAESWIAADPTADLKARAPQRSLPKTLSPDEVEALLAAPISADAPTDALMLRVLYAAGLRVSELVSLTPDNIDFQAGMLRVQGKGEKIRIVPVDADTAALISGYLKSARPRLEARARIKAKARTLFLSRQGHAFTRQGFWKLLKKYALQAGIGVNVSPHVLRHAFATHLLERGMNLRSLQMLLGHADISTTEIYSHVSVKHLHETVRRAHPKSRA